jgi:hypothetical protein
MAHQIITLVLVMSIKSGVSSLLSAISLIFIAYAGYIKYLAGKQDHTHETVLALQASPHTFLDILPCLLDFFFSALQWD